MIDGSSKHDIQFFSLFVFLRFVYPPLVWDGESVLSPCFQSTGHRTASKRVGLLSASRLLNTVSPASRHLFPFFFLSHLHLSPRLPSLRWRTAAGGQRPFHQVRPVAALRLAGPSLTLLATLIVPRLPPANCLLHATKCSNSSIYLSFYFFAPPRCCHSIRHSKKWLRP